LLAAAIAPHTGGIFKNCLGVFTTKFLHIDISNFAFRFSQSSGIALES